MRYLVCVLILFLVGCDDVPLGGPYPDMMFWHALVGRVTDGSAVPRLVGLTVRTSLVAPIGTYAATAGSHEKYGDCFGTRISQRLEGIDTHGNFSAAFEVYRFSGNYCVYLEVLSADRVVASKTLEIRFMHNIPDTTEVTIPISN